MTIRTRALVMLALCVWSLHWCAAASQADSLFADPYQAGSAGKRSYIPQQILQSGVNSNVSTVSPNTLRLAEDLGLVTVIERITKLRNIVHTGPPTVESLAQKQEFIESMMLADHIIQETNLDVDFTLAEIAAEQSLYTEMLARHTADRDRSVARTNAASFYANGALWAIAEALSIPTYKYGKFAIPSGINGIIAGILPSVASLYAMQQSNGKAWPSETQPNMLAKLFGYPTTTEIEYPKPVWHFLNSVPVTSTTGRTRRDALIDRWRSDVNLQAFSHMNKTVLLDTLTASVSHPRGLTIEVLIARQAMLNQVGAEVMKMKRFLLELSMAVSGQKRLECLKTSTGDPDGDRQVTGELNKSADPEVKSEAKSDAGTAMDKVSAHPTPTVIMVP